MGVVSITSSGNTNNLEKFLKEMKAQSMFDAIEPFAQEGVSALEAATPMRSGVSAGSWYYEIIQTATGCRIAWHNANVDEQGVPIVILIQYGHGTRQGGYVQPYDFINPAIQKVFEDISDAVWKAVQSA